MGIEKCDVFVVCKSFHFVMIFKFSKGNRNEELSSNASGVITSVVFSGFFRRFRRLTRRNSELDEDFG